jgi:hypothetical protein
MTWIIESPIDAAALVHFLANGSDRPNAVTLLRSQDHALRARSSRPIFL